MKWSLVTAILVQLASPGWSLAANDHISVRDVSSVLKREPAMERAIRSVVHIGYNLPKAGAAQGSGFFVSPNHILTAMHVVAMPGSSRNGGAPAGCDPSNCPDLHPGATPAPDLVPCEKLMIAGVYTHGRSTRGRSFKCRQYVLADADADAVLIETIGANDNWMPLGTDAQIDTSRTVDFLGYPGGNWFLHCRECQITEAKLAHPLKTDKGNKPGDLYFDTRCVADHGASGGLAMVIDGKDQFSAVGIIDAIDGQGKTTCVRVPDLVQRHPTEFQAVAAAAQGN